MSVDKETKIESMESSILGTDWMEYYCKSGELLFYYNKVTAEHRWRDISNNYKNGTPINGRPQHCVETQTEDYGCSNGCTSVHIDGGLMQPNNVVTTETQSENHADNMNTSTCLMSQDCNLHDEKKYSIEGSQLKMCEEISTLGTSVSAVFSGDNVSHETIESARYSEKSTKSLSVSSVDSKVVEDESCNVEIPISKDFSTSITCNPVNSEDTMRTISDDVLIKLESHQLSRQNDEFMATVNNVSDGCPNSNEGPEKSTESFTVSLHVADGMNVVKESHTEIANDFLDDVSIKVENQWGVSHQSSEFIDTVNVSDCWQNFNEGAEKSITVSLVDGTIVEDDRYMEDMPSDFSPSTDPVNTTEDTVRTISDYVPMIVERLLKCELCDSHFGTCEDYHDHLQMHCSIASSKCPVCGKVFKRRTSLMKHLQVHVDIYSGSKSSSSPYKCFSCNKIFSTRFCLKQHQAIHTGARPYQCGICGKTFSYSSGLSRHKLLHTGVKPHQCQVCGKTFRQKETLKVHEHLHTGIKPYRCKTCNMDFANGRYLKRHERRHNGLQPYKLKTCEKTFEKPRCFEIHETIQSGHEPYQ